MDSNIQMIPPQDKLEFWDKEYESSKNSRLSKTKTTDTIENDQTQPKLDLLYSSGKVNKLDSEVLDNELTSLLEEPLYSSFSYINPKFVDKWKTELQSGLQGLLLFLSFSSGKNATYGQKMQNLTYKTDSGSTKRRLYLYSVALVASNYGWQKLTFYLSDKRWADMPMNTMKYRVWRTVHLLEKVFRALTLANFILFISNGKYKTILERVFGLKLTFSKPQFFQSVSFEFMNRQMVWHAFTEFLMFIIPLLNTTRIKSHLTRSIRQAVGLPPVYIDPEISSLRNGLCPICYTEEMDKAKETGIILDEFKIATRCRITNGYKANCGHEYCYVCIKKKMSREGTSCSCLRCGNVINGITSI
ncbi:hypothetical protein BB559_003861 [Furculomyces boomerangus]|uniref:RING-type E3 ubiquitin transferase (cysteine targeting) n=2 Tax=Harpellales TaxID=61421 RepID=A0A2T9YIA0_9FUNG|nr:hypothetical protein BB559_003861 [Furculomyces boomerangus]PWA00518.1 hypothetical protein BB558_003448 [Smittium angustum]